MNLEYFSLPLARPLATARGEVTDRTGYLVRVEEPAPGVGEATPLPGWTESFDDCEAALRGVRGSKPPYDLDGLPPAARHGVALAQLDARARSAGLPLHRYLGAPAPVESIPVNATVGDAGPEETVAGVERAVDVGFPAVKLKVGVRSVEADLDRVRAVRRTCPGVDLRLDANGAWTWEQAVRAFDRLGDLDVAYVEQPLPAAELHGHADLRGRGVGVALDEGLYEHGLDAIFDATAADVLVLKPMAMGGPDVALETAVVARGAGIEPVVTTTVDGAVARAAAVHVAAAIPDVGACGLATGDRLRSDLIPDPAPVRDGRVAVPRKEGNAPVASPGDDA